MEQFAIAVAWFAGLVGGVFVSLGMVQALTGRSVMRKRSNWSVGEIKMLGVVWAVAGLVLAISALVGSLQTAAHQSTLFVTFALWPIILGGPIGQLLIEQRHYGRWPFKDRVSHT
jgi:hypothetical protein